MKRQISLFINGILFLGLITFLIISCAPREEIKTSQKPRLLITTDIGGDPDDMQSLTRLLVYANEFEIEGLVASASGTIGELDEAVVRDDLIEKFIKAYGVVQPNLKKHDDDYPHADSLLALVKKGNPNRGLEYIGDGHLTEGSEWIIRQVDASDRPLNISIWGGQSDLAQALWQVKAERSSSAYETFVSKIRVHDIADQDSLFNHIKANHPSLFYILNRASLDEDKRNAVFRGMYLDGNEDITSLAWLNDHVIKDHGPLGALYPTKTWTAPNPHGNMKEGDTPSWFYFLDNGLNVPSKPGYGGWGGRFEKLDGQYFNDAEDRYRGVQNARVTVARWREDFQHHFAARMDWCVKDVAVSNHPPKVKVDGAGMKDMVTSADNGSGSNETIVVNVKAGEKIQFDASGSTDPDGDKLHFEWVIYPEAGKLGREIDLQQAQSKVDVTIPELDEGEEVHLILNVKDDGKPTLTSYQRVILR